MVDWLIPSSGIFARRWLWQRIDEVIVIRTGDRSHLERRFGIDPERSRFVHFPAPVVAVEEDDPVGEASDYVYSAGWAHRDWATLSAALLMTDVPAVISCDTSISFPPRVTVLPQLSPEEGGRYLRNATCLVLSLEETPLPSGPLVLLDGMARGKPVIATRVNGSVDYVADGKNGMLVPPGDPEALASAIRRVFDDKPFAEALGKEARLVGSQLSGDRFWSAVLLQDQRGEIGHESR